jgi:hypothetical protein
MFSCSLVHELATMYKKSVPGTVPYCTWYGVRVPVLYGTEITESHNLQSFISRHSQMQRLPNLSYSIYYIGAAPPPTGAFA